MAYPQPGNYESGTSETDSLIVRQQREGVTDDDDDVYYNNIYIILKNSIRYVRRIAITLILFYQGIMYSTCHNHPLIQIFFFFSIMCTIIIRNHHYFIIKLSCLRHFNEINRIVTDSIYDARGV